MRRAATCPKLERAERSACEKSMFTAAGAWGIPGPVLTLKFRKPGSGGGEGLLLKYGANKFETETSKASCHTCETGDGGKA